jgi:carbamoyltransferase
MNFWGINALNHGSSLAVFNNYKLVSNVSSAEDNLPSEVIRRSLDQNGAPDRIFWYEQPWLKKSRQLLAQQWSRAFDLSVLPKNYLKTVGLHYAPVTYTSHHASHAAAGYYTSPFNHCAIVVLDAIGDWDCATIWEAKHGEMKKVWSRRYPHSLGLFYSAFTDYVGLTPIKDENVLQQMASQGNSQEFLSYVRRYFDDSVLTLNTNFHRGVLNWDHNQLTTMQDQCNVAAAVQTVFEEQLQGVMETAKELTGADCLVYMGGCAMNSDANKRVVEPMWKYVWSLSNPGDASSAMGAVLYHTKHRITLQDNLAKHITIKV